MVQAEWRLRTEFSLVQKYANGFPDDLSVSSVLLMNQPVLGLGIEAFVSRRAGPLTPKRTEFNWGDVVEEQLGAGLRWTVFAKKLVEDGVDLKRAKALWREFEAALPEEVSRAPGIGDRDDELGRYLVNDLDPTGEIRQSFAVSVLFRFEEYWSRHIERSTVDAAAYVARILQKTL
jgi:hypothetical protein